MGPTSGARRLTRLARAAAVGLAMASTVHGVGCDDADEPTAEYWLTLVESSSSQPVSEALGRVVLAQGSDATGANLRLRVQGGRIDGLEDRGCSGSSCCLDAPRWPLSFLARCEDVECVVLAELHTAPGSSEDACSGSPLTSAVPVVLRRPATNSLEAPDAGLTDANVDAGEGGGS